MSWAGLESYGTSLSLTPFQLAVHVVSAFLALRVIGSFPT